MGIVLAVALILGSLVYQTGRDFAARLFAREAELRGDGYMVKITYPTQLWFSDAGARGALLTARMEAVPSPTTAPIAATSVVTPAIVLTPTLTPTPDQTTTAVTTSPAATETPTAPPSPTPTGELLYTLVFTSDAELIFTDATGQPVPPRLPLTAPEGRQPSGALYLRAAHLPPTLQGQVVTLTARLQPPETSHIPLEAEPPLQITYESLFGLVFRASADRVLGDQAFLLGIALAVIGWAVESLRRTSDAQQAAMRERIAAQQAAMRKRVDELTAMVDSDLASAVLEYHQLAGALPQNEVDEQLRSVKRRLKLKQTPAYAAALLAEAGARLGEGQIGRCDEVLEACGLQFSELQPHIEAIRNLLSLNYDELDNAAKQKLREELLSALHKIWHAHHDHAHQLCTLLFLRLLDKTKDMDATERASFEDKLELVFLGSSGPKDQQMLRKQQQMSLTLLRDIRLRSYLIVAHVIRRGSDPPQLWTPPWPPAPPEALPALMPELDAFLEDHNLNWDKLQLHPNFTAQSIIQVSGPRLVTETAPLAFCEAPALCHAVATQLANLSLPAEKPANSTAPTADSSCFPVWFRMPQRDLPNAYALPLLRLVAGAACDSWWRLMTTAEGVSEILDLPFASQHQLGRLLVWNAGSLPAFAARLAQRADPESSTLEYQQLERRVTEALAGERLPRLNQGDLLAALAIRPPGRDIATLILVDLQPGTALAPQLEQLCSLAPALARDKVVLRLFAPPEARTLLTELGLRIVAWPTVILQDLANYYVQRASEQGVFETYEDLRQSGVTLPTLDVLMHEAGGSPTKLLAGLRAALLKAAGVPPAL